VVSESGRSSPVRRPPQVSPQIRNCDTSATQTVDSRGRRELVADVLAPQHNSVSLQEIELFNRSLQMVSAMQPLPHWRRNYNRVALSQITQGVADISSSNPTAQLRVDGDPLLRRDAVAKHEVNPIANSCSPGPRPV
jgi:hypothetical protein